MTAALDPASRHIDLAGLMARAVALPVAAAVIATLEVRGNRLFYETRPPQLIDGDLPGQDTQFHVFDLSTQSGRIVARGLDNYSLAGDGSAVAIRRDGAWQIATTGPIPGAATTLDTSALRATIDPRLAWREMFFNAWRLDRDVFFSKADGVCYDQETVEAPCQTAPTATRRPTRGMIRLD